MPTYEYMCGSCKKTFEVEQSIKEKSLTNCPECGDEALKRLINNTTFVLLGGGWAADNYSKKS